MADPVQTAIKRATLAAQQEVVKLDAAALEELQQLYQQAADDIAQRIAAQAGRDGNVMLSELQSVLAQVQARLKELAAARNALLNETITTGAELGTQPLTAQGIAPLIAPHPSPLPLAGEGVLLTRAAAMTINHEAQQFVRTFIGADGLQLSDRIWRIDRHARDVVVNYIEQAIIQGHGAAQAARELLAQGQGVPAEVADKMGAGNAQAMGKSAGELLTGQGSPMDNAMRLMRTELNRAHGTAYAKGALAHPDAVGVRYKLSPAHPKPDICDLLSTQNLYGLGAGVYPSVEASGWPAHPNILSFLEIVFKDEVTAEDQAGKETSMEALARLTPEQRRGALGVNKAEVFDQGKMSKGMIRSKWSSVKKRISNN
jgi:hypothetical protein